MTLEEFVLVLRGEAPGAAELKVELVVKDGAPPQTLERLAKLSRLGLLNGDVILSLVANAPIDPLGLIGTLVAQDPVGWTFSSLDCSVVRVLSRGPSAGGDPPLAKLVDEGVRAAVRIDLLDNTVETLVRNKVNQLTSFARFSPMDESRPPGPWILDHVKKMTDEAIFAAAREN